MRFLGWICLALFAWYLWNQAKAKRAAQAGAGQMRPRYWRTGPVPDPTPSTMGKLIQFAPNSVTGGDCGCGK